MVRAEPDPRRARARRPHRLQVLRGDREHRGDPLTADEQDPAARLLDEGARLHREGVSAHDLLLLLARETTADDDLVRRAVERGAEVLAGLPAPGAGAVADPGSFVLAAAATAAVAAGLGADDEAVVADLAGCLAVVGPPAPAPGADLRAGHALVAAWLAVRLHAAGVQAPEGAALATARTVAGAP